MPSLHEWPAGATIDGASTPRTGRFASPLATARNRGIDNGCLVLGRFSGRGRTVHRPVRAQEPGKRAGKVRIPEPERLVMEPAVAAGRERAGGARVRRERRGPPAPRARAGDGTHAVG